MSLVLRRLAVGAAVIAVCAAVFAAPTTAQTIGPAQREVILIRVSGWSLPALLERPAVAALAAAGGAAVAPSTALLGTNVDPGDPDAIVRERLAASGATRALVVVVGIVPAQGDPLLPVVVAEGSPAELLAGEGTPRALYSDSTHRDGVVTDRDVLATVNAFWGAEPTVDPGTPLVASDAAAPIDLHRRFLQRVDSLGAVGAVFAVLATVIGLGALAALWLRRRVPSALLRVFAWSCMAVPALALMLLLAGHLPVLTTGYVIGSVSLGTASVTFVGGRRGARGAPALIGSIVLVGLAVEAATGWRGQLLAFLGASLLDGGRFYGLSNAFIGLLVGSALFVAWRLPRDRGVALLVLTGIFAGFPMLGSNVGGATTAFAAAGLWWGVGRRGRMDIVAILAGAVAAIVGVAVVFAAHALWPTTTHVDGAIASGGLIDHYIDRVRLGVRMIREHPLALIPALGGPMLFALVLRPPAVFREGFALDPGSREVVSVAAVASLVAYVANDSGAAAAGLTWGMGLVLALWVSLRAASERMSP